MVILLFVSVKKKGKSCISIEDETLFNIVRLGCSKNEIVSVNICLDVLILKKVLIKWNKYGVTDFYRFNVSSETLWQILGKYTEFKKYNFSQLMIILQFHHVKILELRHNFRSHII